MTETITRETRRESLFKLDRGKRYIEILGVLQGEMTAREIASALGYSDLNAVKPRLTELRMRGIVEAAGKKYDETTGRHVTAYRKKEKQPC